MAYMSNTGTNTVNSPKYRVYHSSNGSTGAEQELPTSGSALRQIKLKWSPVSTKCAVITLSADGWLDADLSNNCYSSAVSWTTTNNFGSVRSSSGNFHYRPFDMAFESTTGNLIVAWGENNTDATKDIAYISVPTATLSLTGLTVNYINTVAAASDMNYTWVSLITRVGTTCVSCNSVLLFGLERSLNDAYFVAWDGTTFENETRTIVEASALGEGGAVALRNSTGLEALAVVSNIGTAGQVNSRVYNFNTGVVVNLANVDYGTGTTNHMSVRCDTLNNNGCLAASIDGTQDLNSIHVANTNTVTLQTTEDINVDYDGSRVADFAWNGSNGTAIRIWGTTTGQLDYRRVTVPDTWAAQSSFTLGGLQSWVQCKTNPTAGDYLAALCLVIYGAGTTTPDTGLISWLGGSDAPKDNTTLTTDNGLGAATATNPHTEVISVEFQLSTTSPGGAFTRTITETVVITDSIVRAIVLIRTTVETMIVSDSVARIWDGARSTSDTIIITTSVVIDVVKGIVDTVVITDSIERIGVLFRATSDTNVITDSITRIGIFTRTTTDSITMSLSISIDTVKQASEVVLQDDVVNRVFSGSRNPVDTNVITDPVQRIFTGTRAMIESIVISDTINRILDAPRLITENVVVSDLIARTFSGTRSPTDTNVITEFVTRVYVGFRDLSVTISTTDNANRVQVITAFITDTIAQLDSIGRVGVFSRAISDSILASDVSQRIGNFVRSMSETIIITDMIEAIKVSGSQAFERLISETVAISDSILRIFNGTRSPIDTSILSDSIARVYVGFRDLSVTISTTDNADRVQVITAFITDTITPLDSVQRIGSFFRSITESNTITDSIDRIGAFFRSTVESVTISDSILKDAVKGITETIPVTDNINRIFSGTRILSEASIITDPIQRIFFGTRGTSETLSISDSVSRAQLVFVSMIESVIGSDNLQRIFDGTRAVIESSTITDTINQIGVFFRSTTDTLVITDPIQRIFSGTRLIDNTILSSDSVSTVLGYARSITDTSVITDSISRIFSGTREMIESMTISDPILRVADLTRTTNDILSILDNIVPQSYGSQVYYLREPVVGLTPNGCGSTDYRQLLTVSANNDTSTSIKHGASTGNFTLDPFTAESQLTGNPSFTSNSCYGWTVQFNQTTTVPTGAWQFNLTIRSNSATGNGHMEIWAYKCNSTCSAGNIENIMRIDATTVNILATTQTTQYTFTNSTIGPRTFDSTDRLVVEYWFHVTVAG